MRQIAEDDNGREVMLAMGEAMELSLAENPTTGYHWELNERGEPVCDLVKDDFEAPTGAPGSGGVHRWQFRAVKPGSGEIGLQYRRPWEKDAAPARTYQVSVRVHN
jgi:inhibitor of cysteine peptidase